jgi:hypothetical protein
MLDMPTIARLTVDADRPVWLVGFFTGRLHAVRNPEPTLVFRGVPLTWSICGAPAVANTHGAPAPYCMDCIRHVGIASLLTADPPTTPPDPPA